VLAPVPGWRGSIDRSHAAVSCCVSDAWYILRQPHSWYTASSRTWSFFSCSFASTLNAVLPRLSVVVADSSDKVTPRAKGSVE